MTNKKKAILMIPLADNEGRQFNKADIEAIKQGIIKIAGGYTASQVQGAWHDKASGKVYFDNNLKIEVITDNDNAFKGLKAYCKIIARKLGQNCIYFESFEVNCDFINA